ncbi:hypothetical protein MACH18_04710 [Phaeobacter italicus]|nr:hypothetical protein MACH18_04710 [Phaeobacter italicus]
MTRRLQAQLMQTCRQIEGAAGVPGGQRCPVQRNMVQRQVIRARLRDLQSERRGARQDVTILGAQDPGWPGLIGRACARNQGEDKGEGEGKSAGSSYPLPSPPSYPVGPQVFHVATGSCTARASAGA